MQWESFKLWEAFAAGAAVLMPHLEAHGMRLPVMPVAGEHYVPIAFDNASVDALAAKLQSGAVDFGRIGAAGRKWALEHYTPKAYGARFLADVARARRRKKER